MNVKCIVNGKETELPLAGYQQISLPGLGTRTVPVPKYSGHFWLEYNADMTMPIITDIPPNPEAQRSPASGDKLPPLVGPDLKGET